MHGFLDHMGLVSLSRTDLNPEDAKCMISQETISVALHREEGDVGDGRMASTAG